jgi:indole-3-glycerol phosphate synthase
MVHHIIGNIIDSTKKRVDDLKKNNSYSGIDKTDIRNIETIINEKKKNYQVPVIAEIKPASPSTFYRDISPPDAASIAKEMDKAGAAAISVLTEPDYFHGSINNLDYVRNESTLPVLRKDFIIDEIQMDEQQTDLILLIASVLGSQLENFVSTAQSKGIQPLVEVHDRNELEKALQTSAKIIGINNRNLNTFEIDLHTTYDLAPIIKQYDIENNTNHIIISESGIDSQEDVKQLINSGADALLIGSSIIKSDDIYSKTKELVESLK